MYALGACSEEFVVCVHGGDWLRKYCPAATVFAQSAGSCVPPLQVPGTRLLIAHSKMSFFQVACLKLQPITPCRLCHRAHAPTVNVQPSANVSINSMSVSLMVALYSKRVRVAPFLTHELSRANVVTM
jgi:hypothetical protein